MSNITTFNKITDLNNLEEAYLKTIKGKNKYKKEALEFEKDRIYNLKELQKELLNDTYEFSTYFRFKVYEPKERIIDAPKFKDKVVQMAILNIIKPIISRKFIHDNYACLNNKGTHKAVDKLNHFIRKAKWLWGENAYILKLDMKHFFYSIDRNVIKREIYKLLNCKRTIKLVCKIIDSASQISPKGLPLGNSINQLNANITLNPLDHYCKRVLGVKFYIRYMDDIFMILQNKVECKYVKNKSIKFLRNNLNLRENENKTKIFPIYQGVNGLGYKNYGTYKLLRNGSKNKIKRKIPKLINLIKDGQMDIHKAQQIINSWKGHAEKANIKNLFDSLCDNNQLLEYDVNVEKFIIKGGK